MRVIKDILHLSGPVKAAQCLVAAAGLLVPRKITDALLSEEPIRPIRDFTRWLGDRGYGIHFNDEGRNGSLALLDYQENRTQRIAWRLLDFSSVGIHIEAESGGDYDLATGLYLPGLQLFWSEQRWPQLPKWLETTIRSVRYRYGLELDARLCFGEGDAVLRWSLAMDPDCGSANEPRWRRGRASLLDTVFGKKKIREVASKVQQVQIPMPEGPLDAVAIWTKHAERRARTKPRYFTTVSFDFAKPVEVGHRKGGWTGVGTSGATIEEGIGQAVGILLKARQENGLAPDGKTIN